MKILILHRVPYYKIDYHRGINHDEHEVTYVGTKERLLDIPRWIKCHKIERLGVQRAAKEVLDIFGVNAKFDRVISVSEYELSDAAIIRNALNISGPNIFDVEKVRDKILMKAAVSNYGIRTPQCLRASEALKNISATRWAGKVVLKPVDGASSQDVSVHKNVKEAMTQMGHYLDAGKSVSKFEVEEFVDGNILHMDGLVSDGVIQCFMASRYIGNCLDYAKGKPLGSFQIDHHSDLQEWAQRCVSAVGIKNSAFHLEAIDAMDGLVFLEIGARVGGADVVDTFELATGIHLPSEELKLYLNEKNNFKVESEFKKKFGWFVFPGHHISGPFPGVSGFESYKKNPNVIRWNELAAGSPLLSSITYQSKEVPLAGLVEGNSVDEVKELIQEIFRKVN